MKPAQSKRKIKKEIDYEKLFKEFEKILERQLTKEEKKIIDLAYKMGKTNQFVIETKDNKINYKKR